MATQLTGTDSTSLVTTEDEIEEHVPASTSYLAVIIVTALVAVAHIPMLIRLASDLWSREHYQFFPFLIPVSAFLMWDGINRLKEPVRAGNQLICFILVLMSGAMLVMSSLVGSGTLAAIASLLTLATVIYGIGGWTLFRECFPGWVILFLAVPPPFRLDDKLITTLQWWVAYANGMVLDVMNIEHIIHGATVKIPGRSLLVEEACSGIHSLFSSLFCALGLCLWLRRSVLHTLILVAMTIYWVLLGNLTRVLLIVIADVKLSADLASEPQHGVLSIVIFIGILGLIASTDRFLLFVSPYSDRFAHAAVQKGRAWTNSVFEMVPEINRSWLASWAVGLLFAIVASFQFWVVGKDLTRGIVRPNLNLAEAGENGLPERMPFAQRIRYRVENRKFNHINGEHSQIWHYAFNNQHICEVSLDYTFTGWHDLTICYRNAGWTLTSKEIDGSPEGKELKDEFMKVEMIMPHTGQRGFLLFCIYNEDGERLDPPSGREGRLFQERIDNIMAKIRGKDVTGMTKPTYQVQVFIPTYGELSDVEKAQAVQLFREIESNMAALVIRNKQSTTPAAQPAEEAGSQEEA